MQWILLGYYAFGLLLMNYMCPCWPVFEKLIAAAIWPVALVIGIWVMVKEGKDTTKDESLWLEITMLRLVLEEDIRARERKVEDMRTWIIEAWVDGGHVGSVEAYWCPGNQETGILPKDDWADWTGDPRKAKTFPSKEEADREIASILEKNKAWSKNMGAVKFAL